METKDSVQSGSHMFCVSGTVLEIVIKGATVSTSVILRSIPFLHISGSVEILQMKCYVSIET